VVSTSYIPPTLTPTSRSAPIKCRTKGLTNNKKNMNNTKKEKTRKRKEKNAHKHRLYLAIATHKTTVKKRKLIHS
jgi:hypothetical protein